MALRRLACFTRGRYPTGGDLDIIRAALISRSILVTNHSELREAVNGHQDLLSLNALDAREALELAKSERPEA